MLASALRFCPCSCRIAPEVVCTASQAVAATEHDATSTDTISSRPSRLLRSGSRSRSSRRRRTGCLLRGVRQLVADAENREQPGRPPRYALDLLAQMHDVHVDRAVADVLLEAVQLFQQPLPGEDPVG